MSKVYEALRQKQHETSGSLQPLDSVDEAEVNSLNSMNADAELVIGDSVLRTVFATEDVQTPTVSASPSEFPPVAPTPGTRPFVSANGFRRLSLAKQEASRLIFQTDPHGLAAEQFRFLRRTLEQRFPNGAMLLITSPAPRDGKTLTSINLSSCLSDSGQSTLLLEGDVRQPTVGKYLGTSSEGPGIEDAFAGTVDPTKTVAYVEELSFCVAMVVHPPQNASRLVTGNGAKQFLKWAREQFHWVVIDSPPVLPAADVAHLVSLADAVLLVVRAQSTPRDLATRAFEMLGDRLYGVVLNEATIESNPYYRHLADYRQKNYAPGQGDVTSANRKRN